MSGVTNVTTNERMSNLISNLDNMASLRVGENYHKEHGWNTGTSRNDLQEQLIQIYFQSVRTDFVSRYNLAMKFKEWVSTTFLQVFNANASHSHSHQQRNEMLNLAMYGYKMIAQLRDIHEGKGECRLAYDMLYAYYEGIADIYSQVGNDKQELIRLNEYTSSMLALEFMQVNLDTDTNEKELQYGSYKDYKYLCHEFVLLHLADELTPEEVQNKYITTTSHKQRTHTSTFRFTPAMIDYLSSHPIISVITKHYGNQIYNDYLKINEHLQNKMTLAGKWAPRASSKLFSPLRKLLFPYVIPEYTKWSNSAIKPNSKQKLELKVETNYRKRLSAINRALNTIQVKQCDKRWSEIDFDKHVTSITLNRQKKAFMKGGDKDRELCSRNFKRFLECVKDGSSTAKGKCISVTDFVKEAKNLMTAQYKDQFTFTDQDQDQHNFKNEKMLLDKQWENKGLNIGDLENFIAMVDTSGSMTVDNEHPLNTAIGLGIRIAEKSLLGNRVMTFSQTPEWVNLQNIPSFTERVEKVSKCNWGYNTNFYAAMNLILTAIVNAKLSSEDVSKLTLVILSDMQMDEADNNYEALFDKIKSRFAKSGREIIGRPYQVPKIVFWNLRKTKGFPSLSNDERSIMISGASDVILNDICEKGIKALDTINPWNIFINTLNKVRYAKLSCYFNKWIE